MFLPLHDSNPLRHIRFPYVNYAILAATCLVFLVQSMLPPGGFEAATVYFGMVPGVVTGFYADPLPFLPEQATLFTYAFLHLDVMHLLSNMLFLWIFGDNVEDALGHLRYLFFYFACAVLAAGAHMLTDLASSSPLIGASGAVAGVMGAYVLLFPHARLFVLARIIIPLPLPVPAFWMLGFWILTQLFYAFAGSAEPVAWWAHIGGVLSGAILAALFRRRDFPLLGGR